MKQVGLSTRGQRSDWRREEQQHINHIRKTNDPFEKTLRHFAQKYLATGSHANVTLQVIQSESSGA